MNMYYILQFLKNPWRWYKRKQDLKKRLAELKNQDPFIYR
jgi:hypothetical protein